VVALDRTVFCKSANSVAVLANNVFMLSNQGVVAISDTSVQVVSREIEPSILPLLTFSNLAANTVGASYESERSYFLSTMTNSSDTAPTQTFVYNIFTKTWVRHTYGFTTAIVEPSTDKLFLVKPSDTNVYRERKTFTDDDYADPETSITITSISGSTVVFSIIGTVTPQVGWVISQAGTNIAITTLSLSVQTGLWTASMNTSPPTSWSTGSATIYPSIAFEIRWDAWTAGQPGFMKHVRQVEFLTDNIGTNNTLSQMTGTFRTDIDQNADEVPITSNAYRWGTMPWGSTPWGGQSDSYSYPLWVPINKQYARVMNVGAKHFRAKEKITINGLSYTFELISERTSK